jgi:hypothetical protein
MSVAAPAPPNSTAACRKHPEKVAWWRCDECGKVHCDECLKVQVPGRIRTESCPACKGYLRKAHVPSPDDVPTGFPGMLQDAAAYPLRGHGLVLIFLGGLFLAFIVLLSRSWKIRIGLFFAVFGAGYLAAYMLHIVEASANGKRKLPEWPEFSNFWDSICIPFFQVLLPVALCVLIPACAPVVLLGWNEQAFAIGVALAIVCSFYMPMAILSIAVNNAVAGMHPATVLPAIGAVFPRYAAIWLVLVTLGTTSQLLYFFVLDRIPFVGIPLDMWTTIYLVAVEARLLGSLYHQRRGKLKLV